MPVHGAIFLKSNHDEESFKKETNSDAASAEKTVGEDAEDNNRLSPAHYDSIVVILVIISPFIVIALLGNLDNAKTTSIKTVSYETGHHVSETSLNGSDPAGEAEHHVSEIPLIEMVSARKKF